ncbi:MAG: methylmalonyl-CoA mutase family protein, partial [Thermoanaerobaculia bacterium]
LVESAGALIRKVDGMGGALKAIEAGFFQREIQESAWRAQRAIELKEQIVVGVNEFVGGEERPIPMLVVDPAMETDQVLRLQALRARRDPAAAERRRAALVEAAREGRNVLPPLVDAVTDLVTLGEIIESLRSVFGDHRESAAW